MMGATVSPPVSEAATLLRVISDPAAAREALDKIVMAQEALDVRSAAVAKMENAAKAKTHNLTAREARLVENEKIYAAKAAMFLSEMNDFAQKQQTEKAGLAAVRFQQEETRRSLLAKDADVNQRAQELGQRATTLNRQAASLDARQKALENRDAALMIHEKAFTARRERLMAAMAEK